MSPCVTAFSPGARAHFCASRASSDDSALTHRRHFKPRSGAIVRVLTEHGDERELFAPRRCSGRTEPDRILREYPGAHAYPGVIHGQRLDCLSSRA
jgi:hypothetical protein